MNRNYKTIIFYYRALACIERIRCVAIYRLCWDNDFVQAQQLGNGNDWWLMTISSSISYRPWSSDHYFISHRKKDHCSLLLLLKTIWQDPLRQTQGESMWYRKHTLYWTSPIFILYTFLFSDSWTKKAILFIVSSLKETWNCVSVHQQGDKSCEGVKKKICCTHLKIKAGNKRTN